MISNSKNYNWTIEANILLIRGFTEDEEGNGVERSIAEQRAFKKKLLGSNEGIIFSERTLNICMETYPDNYRDLDYYERWVLPYMDPIHHISISRDPNAYIRRAIDENARKYNRRMALPDEELLPIDEPTTFEGESENEEDEEEEDDDDDEDEDSEEEEDDDSNEESEEDDDDDDDDDDVL